MEIFKEYLEKIDDEQHRDRMSEVLGWVRSNYPDLVPRIAWNQPMFTDHGTFIIGFSEAKNHMAIAPERAVIRLFSEQITQAGYDHTNELMRISWKKPVDYTLLTKIIDYNVSDKANYKAFWRK